MKLITLFALQILALNAIAQSNPIPTPRHKFTVIAHRGDHVKYPENSFAAYQEAIRNGADFVEIDLRTTKDSVLVSMHDGSLTRMTGVNRYIKDMRFDEIKSLQLRSRDSADKARYLIPTFEDILKTCRNRIYVYIDFKDASEAAAYAMLQKYHMERQVLVYINSPQQFINWRKLAPQMALMVSLPDNINNVADTKRFIEDIHPDVLDGNWKNYSVEIVKYLSDQHLSVWPDIQSADESNN